MGKFINKLKSLFIGRGYRSRGSASEQIKIIEHFEKYFGKAEYKLVGDTDGIDIYVIPATREHACNTLFTVGMSVRPMTVPEGMEGYEYCELMMHLPFYWNIDHKPENYWPVEWLRSIAEYPATLDTWLFYGTLLPLAPLGETASSDALDGAAEGYTYRQSDSFSANTRMSRWAVGATRMLPAESERDAFITVDVGDNKLVYCLTLLPLHEDEARFLHRHGAEQLFDLFDDHEISDIIIPARKSVFTVDEPAVQL
ncbi:MAG: suppressor of fused domain protein [Clostridiales bacterium]|nr:suppressor of fused domain protein [Clostridiales bacterium]